MNWLNKRSVHLHIAKFLLPSKNQDLKEYGSCTLLTDFLHAQQKLFCADAWIRGSENQGNKSESQFNLAFTFLVAIFINDSNESAHSLEMYISTLTIIKSTAQKRHIIKSNVSSETISYGTFHQNLGKQELQKHFFQHIVDFHFLLNISYDLIEESFATFHT